MHRHTIDKIPGDEPLLCAECDVNDVHRKIMKEATLHYNTRMHRRNLGYISYMRDGRHPMSLRSAGVGLLPERISFRRVHNDKE